jgi:O-antigen/teichoic acid export membrane protein
MVPLEQRAEARGIAVGYLVEVSHMRFIALVVLLFSTAAAHAYVGPGLGLGVIGAILGALLTVILAIAGVIWYPVKRLLKKKRAGQPRDRVEESTQA